MSLSGDLANMRNIVETGRDEMLASVGPFPGVTQEVQIPMRDGHTSRSRIYGPPAGSQDRPRSLVIWYHGGGFCLGAVDEDEQLFRQLCLNLACVVVSVEYRLAPEHPFPTPVDDCWDALQWVCHYRRGIEISILLNLPPKGMILTRGLLDCS